MKMSLNRKQIVLWHLIWIGIGLLIDTIVCAPAFFGITVPEVNPTFGVSTIVCGFIGLLCYGLSYEKNRDLEEFDSQ